MRKSVIILVVFALLFSGLYTSNIYSVGDTGEIRVNINGQYISFDVSPTIVSGRTIVPVRGVFEALGAEVQWFKESRTVLVVKGSMMVLLKIDSRNAYVNEKVVELDVPARIIDGRTFVPLRFISENIGAKVLWDGGTRTVIIDMPLAQTPTSSNAPTPSNTPTSSNAPTSTPSSIQSFTGRIDSLMGVSTDSILKIFGQPSRIDLSKYGFDWYIYNKDLSKYIQIGVKDGKVVGVYTNSLDFKYSDSIKVGTAKAAVGKSLGSPITYIQKGNIRYRLDDSGQQEVYNVNNSYYTTVFYDVHNDSKVTSYLLINYETEHSLNGYFGKPSEELRKSYEREIFDLANTVRVRLGKEPFKWDEKIAQVARAHSEDMSLNDFFDHTNLAGESPFDRMDKAGIEFMSASENIAWGQMEGIYAHEAWMNSSGHRSNILGDFTYLGVGVYLGEGNNISYTQNFYTP